MNLEQRYGIYMCACSLLGWTDMNHDDGLTVVLSRRQLLLHPHLLLGRKLFLELPQPVFRVFSVFF